MSNLRLAIIALALLLTASAGIAPVTEAAAQSVPDRVTCERCAIDVEEHLVLGSADGPDALPGRPTTMTVDAEGNYWLAFPNTMPMLFGPDGQYRRHMGRSGEGPGEYRVPNVVLTAADSIVVIDNALSRATVIGPDLRPARTIALSGPVMHAVVATWPEEVVLNSDIRSRQRAGYPLHVASFAGSQLTVTRSFGPDDDAFTPATMARIIAPVARAADGNFWSADATRFRIHEFTTNARRVRSLTRRPDWFAAESRWWLGNPRTPPPPYVLGLYTDSQERLWTFVRVPAENWAEAWPDLPPDLREVTGSMAPSREALYSTLIEVIDPAAAAVIARQRVDWHFVGVLTDGRIAVYDEREDGIPRVRIVSIRFGPATDRDRRGL